MFQKVAINYGWHWQPKTSGSWSAETLTFATYPCNYGDELMTLAWLSHNVWETLAICLTVRISVKHFCEMSRSSILSWSVRDCFTVLIKSHVLYFMTWANNFYVISLSAEVPHVLGLLLPLASALPHCLPRFRYVNPRYDVCIWPPFHHMCRTNQVPWEFRHYMASLKLL